MSSATHSSSDAAVNIDRETLVASAQTQPERCAAYLENNGTVFTVDDVALRRAVLRAVIHIGQQSPTSLRPVTEHLRARMDDRDRDVRTATYLALTDVLSYYPQDFAGCATFLTEAIVTGSKQEAAAAGAALVVWAHHRPDLIEPQDAALDALEEFQRRGLINCQNCPVTVSHEEYTAAKQSIHNGTMGARPVERDLVSAASPAPASVATRVVQTVLMIPLLALLAFPAALGWPIQSIRENRHVRLHWRLIYLVKSLGRLRLLGRGYHTARLLCRASWFPSPGSLTNQTPRRPQYHQRTPRYPANWNNILHAIFARDQYQCRNCGVCGGPYGKADLHADHRIPRSEAEEPDNPKNIRTLCEDCLVAKNGPSIRGYPTTLEDMEEH